MESLDFNEEEAINKGGEEIEEVDERVESGREQKAKDPETHANPTELQSGGTIAHSDGSK